MDAILEVENLKTYLPSPRGLVKAVDGVSFLVRAGEIVGVVGESGCGKSTLCYSIMRYLPRGAQVAGQVRLRGTDLMRLSRSQMRRLWGSQLAMIMQNPLTALDPVFTIGRQMAEALHYNDQRSAQASRQRTLDLLRQVHIPDPEERLENYPHQMSGGMKQRVVTAMGTAGGPSLVLADEPTTALDVTIQEQILQLFREIRDHHSNAIILVTHDLGIVKRLCDRVLIMYAGRIVETGETEALFRAPSHPYTQGLLASIPRIGDRRERLPAISGQIPDLAALPPGCAFAPRCSRAMDHCRHEVPPVTNVSADASVRCFLHGGT